MPVVAGKWRRIIVGTVVIVGTIALVPIVALVWLAHALGNIEVGRPRLDPIPVAASACPYLEPVRAEAAELHDLWMRGIGGDLPWPEFRKELAPRLLAFQAELAASEPHVPERVAERFRVVRWEVAIGQAELPRATDAASYAFRAGTQSPLLEGLSALADASDLVGAACGPVLYEGASL